MTEIRRLAGDDWALLRDVRLAALTDAPYAFASTVEREAAFDEWQWRGRLASSSTTFAALGDGRPVGMVTGLPEESGDVHLVGMWVRAEVRGTSVAANLVWALVSWARESEARAVRLWVVSANDRARRFYQRLGFTSTGVRQQMPENPSIAEEQLRLTL
ncbi:MAG: GNAT family N-acetyltransferase [Actinocatenispora sp.]